MPDPQYPPLPSPPPRMPAPPPPARPPMPAMPNQTLPLPAPPPRMPAAATPQARVQGPGAIPANAARRINGPTMEQLVREAYENGYSDVHLGVGESPRFRERGRMITTNHPVTDKEIFNYWLNEILTPPQIEQFWSRLEYDGAYQYEGMARVRINVFIALKGPAMVLRLIPLKILTMEQLGLPTVFQDLCHYHKGLILVTGPTGSGKSTTLAAMVDYINSEMPKHIISIEDPIEFVHQSKRSLIRQREVGIHTLEFDNALKASLREDPDIILIGEMRDRETVNTALKAAQTGHLVFGTLHTNSAVKTIERILNLYKPEEQGPMRMQVAESLVGVIAQGLVRTTDGKRAAIHEIMINTDAIKDYILRGDVEEIEAIIPQCAYDGMCTFNMCLYDLYEAGRIDEETALENSPKPNEMSQILRGRI
ncbi:type IV pilus twitching motility protein PilT [Thermosynechococcaceae cyanobacterium BACA0444]|uniref:Type IV pilus twitching motility protein PilT n=1 Tax=Pseudocalidococcus azoricus BACA0444 TaxID=2918990 RepID=A0AAE4JX59_9CYAN|nr:type IV pilus twitching motility protein PilT [Pseudocalidococcus azoricus]MDS3862170.1 type IV pilus twitching motility protein PilT [Pseudocalidococcus azoricus BACA0444]